MTSSLPPWIRQVPLKTVGVLTAVHIFGKNIESRQILLAGKRYLRNAVENVVNYVLNPILPPLPARLDDEELSPEADEALRNVRDCFNYVFHVQVEYFKILHRLWPERFRFPKTGTEFNLNQFAAKGPTLINSEKRYLILCKIDGAQPFDLDVDWNADFDWIDDAILERFRDRLFLAQEAYADTLRLGAWYAGRDKNLIIPVKTIMDDLSEYFEHLALAAYLMARTSHRRADADTKLICEHLLQACSHLEWFRLDMLRINVFSIVKHDLDRLDERRIGAVVKARAEDESLAGRDAFGQRNDTYSRILASLYKAVAFGK